jgi:hypothetical protein
MRQWNRKGKTLKEISASINRHYDSLTDEEIAENRAWGEFATVRFANRDECSDEWQVVSMTNLKKAVVCPLWDNTITDFVRDITKLGRVSAAVVGGTWRWQIP